MPLATGFICPVQWILTAGTMISLFFNNRKQAKFLGFVSCVVLGLILRLLAKKNVTSLEIKGTGAADRGQLKNSFEATEC